MLASPALSAQDADAAIARITAEATALSASGLPETEVEAWIDGAMRQAGLTVDKPPEHWDVYSRARWDRELTRAPESVVAADADGQSAPPVPGTFSHEPSPYVYQQPQAQAPATTGEPDQIDNSAAAAAGPASLQGPQSQ